MSDPVRRSLPIWPLTAPGMPLPGADLVAMAALEGDEEGLVKSKGKWDLPKVGPALKRLLGSIVYKPGSLLHLTVADNRRHMVETLPGHLWGSKQATGPVPAEVMVISKMPGMDEINRTLNLVGPGGRLLREACRKAEIKGTDDWYVTSLFKGEHPNPQKGSKLTQKWVREFLPILAQELRLVRPKYILCLGTEVLKALLGNKVTMASVQGRVLEYTFCVDRKEPEPVSIIDNGVEISIPGQYTCHTSLLMGCTSPVAVLEDPDNEGEFLRTVAKFGRLVSGERWDHGESGIDHRVIRTSEELAELMNEIRQPENLVDGSLLVAVDAEWHGEHPQNPGAYLRTVQISWAEKKAACIVLSEQGGAPCFQPSQEIAMSLLTEMLKSTPEWPVRVVGHFFFADLEWLTHFGLDLRDEYDGAETWQETRTKGGMDTGLAAHTLHETAELKLEVLATRYTSCPRYDDQLQAWKKSYCAKNKMKAKDLEGYGECPEEILIPYGNYDADVTRRLAVIFNRKLDCDDYGNCCRESFAAKQRAVLGILEIWRTGITIDRERLDKLVDAYMEAKDRLYAEIRTWAKWPEMKLSSVFHVREFLYGEKYNGKPRQDDGSATRLRPPGARSLYLTPLMDTSKPPNAWADLVAEGADRDASPSTNKLAIGILRREGFESRRRRPDGRVVVQDCSKPLAMLQSFRFIEQALKLTFRPPAVVEVAEGVFAKARQFDNVSGADRYKYDSGIGGLTCHDGRIRTRIFPTAETGRWKSSRPNLTQIGKTRDKDLKKILGDKYYSSRSMLVASPGCVLIESDYIGAELGGMAIMSGDEVMIEHYRRNQLPDGDPDQYDIHSNVAAMAFRLEEELAAKGLPISKQGLELAGLGHLRNISKTILFGLAYGRGAKAIALTAREQGVNITVEQAQQVIETVFKLYPRLKTFFEECGERVEKPGWMANMFGSYRRFGRARDRKVLSDLKRQALNYPIQSFVADLVTRAFDPLYHMREELGANYRILLQIHDAVLVEAPIEEAEDVALRVMPYVMQACVPFFPSDLSGVPTSTQAYQLGIETEVYERWGDKMKIGRAWELGISPTVLHYAPHPSGGWVNAADGGKIFLPGSGLVDPSAIDQLAV